MGRVFVDNDGTSRNCNRNVDNNNKNLRTEGKYNGNTLQLSSR